MPAKRKTKAKTVEQAAAPAPEAPKKTTAGDNGTIVIMAWDAEREVYRRYVGQPGIDPDIKPNTPYQVKDGKLTEVPRAN